MNHVIDFFTNPVLLCAIFSWFLAQLIKLFTTPQHRENGSFLQYAFGSGGMPSSHAATVMATCVSCGLIYGFDSPFFAISAVLSVVVMKDATGVRREAGKQAEIINQVTRELNKERKKPTFEETLKELLGHTPLQVAAGAVLGIVMAFTCQLWLFRLMGIV